MSDHEKNIAHQREMFERGERRRILKLIAEKEAADTTLRNQSAGSAMQGFIARGNGEGEYIVKMSFDIARAMVEESKK